MMNIPINKLKKIAVESTFWLACPLEDDNCFDAIMKADVIDRNFENLHGVYRHEVSKKLLTTEQIKHRVNNRFLELTNLLKCVQ